MAKHPGADTRYTYAVARIRVLETRLLTTGDFERLLESDKDRLQEPPFFVDEIINTYNFIYDLACDKRLMEPFMEKTKIYNQPHREDIDKFLQETFYNCWKENLFLSQYIEMAQNLENIKIFFRKKIQGREDKSFYIPRRYVNIFQQADEEYKAAKKVPLLEKRCDDILIDYLKKAKYFHFGPEPLIGYVFAKENEIKNLRIIYTGKINNLSPEEIRSILRISYV